MQLKFLLADNRRKNEEFKTWKYVRQSQDRDRDIKSQEEQDRFEQSIKEKIVRDWLPITSPLTHNLPDEEPGHALVETEQKEAIANIEKGYKPKLEMLQRTLEKTIDRRIAKQSTRNLVNNTNQMKTSNQLKNVEAIKEFVGKIEQTQRFFGLAK